MARGVRVGAGGMDRGEGQSVWMEERHGRVDRQRGRGWGEPC